MINPNLPAVIVGCGPSSERVPYAPDRYTLCAVNDAVRLCDRVDVLAVNDTPVLKRIQDQRSKVGMLIVPRYMHDDPGPSSLTYHRGALDAAGFVAPDLLIFILHTDPVMIANGGEPTYGRCRSTSDSLIAALLKAGVRKFHTVGIEVDGRDGAHPDLPAGHSKTPSHRISIWRHTLGRIKAAGATVSQGVL